MNCLTKDEETSNFKEEYVEEMKEIGLEEIIARNLSYLLMEFERDHSESKTQLDICEMPQMISGQVTRKLADSDTTSREYGWHFTCTSQCNPGSDAFHISTSAQHYYSLSEEHKKAGIFDVIYREYLIDFLIPPKNTAQQIHLIAYRAKRGHDSTIGKALESVKSVKITQLLSVAYLHKSFFVLLVIVYFGNRLLCSKYDHIQYGEIDDSDLNYVESICKHKNQTIMMVAIIFILLSVMNQVFKWIQKRTYSNPLKPSRFPKHRKS